jgi:hypothetical protein
MVIKPETLTSTGKMLGLEAKASKTVAPAKPATTGQGRKGAKRWRGTCRPCRKLGRECFQCKRGSFRRNILGTPHSNGEAYICSRKECVRIALESSWRIRSHPQLMPILAPSSPAKWSGWTPPMISIAAAILERLRCSPRIVTPAVAAANGAGINVCEAAVDVTLPRAWCQPA